MPKIAFVGAGSTVFTRNLVGDVLYQPELRDCTEFALMDIDAERLRSAEIVAGRLVEAHGAGATVTATTDRRAALDGADYVVTSFQVGGYEPSTVIDFEVPKRFGLRQTIADTLGVGGIMRGLRTIPVLLDVCRDMEEVAPDALLLNYVNPMAMLCWAAAEASSIRTVGLCHSVQGTAAQLADDLGLPSVDYEVAGINHVAFFLRLEHEGEDLYPRLREVTPPDWNRVRYKLFEHFGHFVTESSEHFAEYSPWFIKDGREDLIEAFNVPLDEYPRRCEAQIAAWDASARRSKAAGRCPPSAATSTAPTSSAPVRAGRPFKFNGNVPNRRRTAAADRQPSAPSAASRCRAWPRRRDRAAARRRSAAPARGADPDQRERSRPDRRGGADRASRRGLPGRDARPAHGRGAVPGRDRRAGRRAAGSSRRLDSRARRRSVERAR